MSDIPALCWTTREGVARDLITLVDRSPELLASNAARLLEHLAGPSDAPELLRLACCRDSPYWVRVQALRGFRRVGGVAPLAALQGLLDEQPLAPDDSPRSCSVVPPTTPPLINLVGIFQAPDELALLFAWLARAAPALRRDLVSDLVMRDPPPSPALLAWVMDRWLDDVATRGPEKDDADVTWWIAERHPEGSKVALVYWSTRARDLPGLLHAMRSRKDLALLLDGPGRLEAARQLVLPLPDLLAVLGFDGLRAAVKAAVHAMCAYKERPGKRYDAPTEYRFRDALDLLGAWSEGPAVARGLLQSASLTAEMRKEITLALFRQDRDGAFRAALAHPDGSPALRRLVRAMRREPREGDGDRLLQAARHGDDGVRYLAVDALEAAGEDGDAWKDFLRALARRAPPVLRVRAAAALARRGEAGWEETLAAAAVAEPDVSARGEAIRGLARLDGADRHFDLFERALLGDHAHAGKLGYHTPAAEQAAIALGVVGGERALTPLIRACLVGQSNALVDVIEPILTLLDGEDEATGAPGERMARIRGVDQGWASTWEPC